MALLGQRDDALRWRPSHDYFYIRGLTSAG